MHWHTFLISIIIKNHINSVQLFRHRFFTITTIDYMTILKPKNTKTRRLKKKELLLYDALLKYTTASQIHTYVLLGVAQRSSPSHFGLLSQCSSSVKLQFVYYVWQIFLQGQIFCLLPWWIIIYVSMHYFIYSRWCHYTTCFSNCIVLL